MTERLTLDDLFEIASEVSNKSPADLRRSALSVDLLDSALHAPFAGFGDQDLYERFETKVGILGYRLVKAHGLPDWNKRTAVAAMLTFARINGHRLGLEHDVALEATVDAASNQISETAFVEFIATSTRKNLPTS